QVVRWTASQELDVLTRAMYHARELAMARMEAEAAELGADGIVGVRLDIGRYEWGADLAEFISVGTAVKHRGGELHRAPNGRPFTSDLSGQDFAKLLRAGYRPVGLVMGNCVYHVARQGMLTSLKQMGKNVEMSNFTQALYEARELAMERMQREADELQAGGIVGARIIERSHGWGSHVIEFFALGTGVVATSDEHEIEKPAMVLPLTG
ncbi:MAG TPA: heavy metal-binding domain-containing protein, partial [Solirubrobacteraceae bacterium]|nr:heavy metal-binding domain-containing protein [Solirubrobacteraceae bacterium]